MVELVIPEKYDGDDVAKWVNDREPDTIAKLYPGKHYTINNIFTVTEKQSLTLLGNGSVIHREDEGWNSPNPRTNTLLRFVRCLGLNVQGIVGIGPHPNGGLSESAYVEALEAQHGMEFLECAWFSATGNILCDVYGDIIYIGGRANKPSMIFNIANNWGARTGRQGIAVCNAKHGKVQKNRLWDIRRSMFDAEPIDKTWIVEDVSFLSNVLGAYRGYFFAALGEGSIYDLYVNDNLSQDYLTVEVNNRGSDEPQPRGDIYFQRNRSQRPNFSSPSGKVMVFRDVDGVTVKDNFQHSLARVIDFARFDNCKEIDYANNLMRVLP